MQEVLKSTRPQVYKTFFSCSTQLSMKISLLLNLSYLTDANSFLLNIADHGNFTANKHENAETIVDIFIFIS